MLLSMAMVSGLPTLNHYGSSHHARKVEQNVSMHTQDAQHQMASTATNHEKVDVCTMGLSFPKYISINFPNTEKRASQERFAFPSSEPHYQS